MKILIFGGGINQLTLIQAARDLDIKCIVIDPNIDAPGKTLADSFYQVDPADYESTKEIAVRNNVNGIVTSQMENPLFLMAKLADELRFTFPTQEAIRNARNKFIMKSVLIQRRVPTAKGINLKHDETVTIEKLGNLSFPLIIKPIDSHSSKGVVKVNSITEIEQYESLARNYSSDKSLLIEEFIEGKEYSIEALTFHGTTSIIQYTEKITTAHPYNVEMGHIQPADLSLQEQRDISNVVRQAIDALGIDNTASHTELKMTLDGPIILEIGARLGGDFISSYLTQASTGVNMDKASIEIALNQRPNIEQTKNNYSYIKYLQLNTGKRIKTIGDWRSKTSTHELIFGNVLIKPGEIVPNITDSAKRPAFIIVESSSKKGVIEKAEEIANIIETCIEYED